MTEEKASINTCHKTGWRAMTKTMTARQARLLMLEERITVGNLLQRRLPFTEAALKRHCFGNSRHIPDQLARALMEIARERREQSPRRPDAAAARDRRSRSPGP